MSLGDWRSNGWIVEHESSKQEISELLGVVERELADARVEGLSTDGKFRCAYDAVLQIAAAARTSLFEPFPSIEEGR